MVLYQQKSFRPSSKKYAHLRLIFKQIIGKIMISLRYYSYWPGWYNGNLIGLHRSHSIGSVARKIDEHSSLVLWSDYNCVSARCQYTSARSGTRTWLKMNGRKATGCARTSGSGRVFGPAHIQSVRACACVCSVPGRIRLPILCVALLFST